MTASTFLLLFAALLGLSRVADAQCSSPTPVNDASTQNPPVFDAANSGLITSDRLTLKFTWPSYGTARTILTAQSGFVSRSNPSVVCTAASGVYLLQSSQVFVDQNSCTDFTNQQDAWGQMKLDCGSDFFESSTVGNNYQVAFRYRIAYNETLSDKQERTTQNDYSFVVSTPTQFNVTSNMFTLEGTTTFVTQQTVTSDTSGELAIQVTMMSDCRNQLHVNSVVETTATTAIVGNLTQPSTTGVALSGTGTQFDGLCAFVWTVGLTPTGQTSTCNIDGDYTIDFNITFADGSVFETTAALTLASSDTCSVISFVSNAPTFTLLLYTKSHLAGGTEIVAASTVSYHSTAHWELTLTPPSVDSAPEPVGYTIQDLYWSSNGSTWNLVSDQAAISLANDGTSFPSYVYDFSYVWQPAVFTQNGPIEIKVTVLVTYPTIQKRSGAGSGRAQTQTIQHSYSVASEAFSLAPSSQAVVTGQPQQQSDNTPVIVGAVVGSVALVALLGGIMIVFFMFRRRARSAELQAAAATAAAGPSNDIAVLM